MRGLRANRFLSAVPVGTRVVSLEVNEEVTTIEFSGEILTPEMDELRLATLFDQVRLTLEQFGMGGSLRLQSEGRLLSDYLARKPVIEPRPKVQLAPSLLAAGALAGKTISLSPGHGKVWTGSIMRLNARSTAPPLIARTITTWRS